MKRAALEWFLVAVACDVLVFLVLQPKGFWVPPAHLPALACALWAGHKWANPTEREHGKEEG